MAIKEIKEISDKIKEIIPSVAPEEDNFIEKDFAPEDEEDSNNEKVFSISDTMLGRNEQAGDWGDNSLEDSILEEDFEEDGYDDFGEEGFSYEAISNNSSSELYGVTSSGSDFYGAVGGNNSKNMYNEVGGAGKDNNFYNTMEGNKKDSGSVQYSMFNKNNKNIRVRNKSRLENGLNKKRRF